MKSFVAIVGILIVFYSCESANNQLEGSWQNKGQIDSEHLTSVWTFKGREFKYSANDGQSQIKRIGRFQVTQDSIYTYCDTQRIGDYQGRREFSVDIVPADTVKYRFILKQNNLKLIGSLRTVTYQRIR